MKEVTLSAARFDDLVPELLAQAFHVDLDDIAVGFGITLVDMFGETCL